MTTPADQWWSINGEEIMRALRSTHDGTDPDVAYLELIANSTTDTPKADE